MTALHKLLEASLKSMDPEATENVFSVDPGTLNPIKALLMQMPAYAQEAPAYLLHKLKSKSQSNQGKSLFLIDYLFCRSRVFRETLVDKMSFLFGIFDSSSASNGVRYSPHFKNQLARLVELWDLRYGKGYPTLRAGARYLRESVGIINTDLVEEAQRLIQESKGREAIRIRNAHEKRREILREYKNTLKAVNECVDNITRCFSILFPSFEEEYGQHHSVNNVFSKAMNGNDVPVTKKLRGDNAAIIATSSSASSSSSSSRYPDGADVSDDDDDEIDWEDGFVSDSDEKRARSSNILITAGLGSEHYNLEVTVKKSAKGIINDENRVIFEQLKEYSDHLEKFGVTRLRDMLCTLSTAQTDDINQRNSGNLQESGAILQTEEALTELRDTQEKVSRILMKSKRFFAD